MITPGRVVVLCVVPATTMAALCAWAAIDGMAYAYRLYRSARSLSCS